MNKPTKKIQALAQKLYEIGIDAQHQFDERYDRPAWKSLSIVPRKAWYAIAEYVLSIKEKR